MTEAEAVKLLGQQLCACGAAKVRKTAFCGSCYHALPDELRQGLWRKIGKGFEAAYEAALAHLRTTWRIKA
jgi:hypothetical protein